MYCSVGVRRERVGLKVVTVGYQHVHNLYGSLFGRVNEGNPVADKQEKPNEGVHG
jgi:predicted sulfurtransferase